MNIWHQQLEDGRCVEVNCDDRLVGYVIFFSGGWDGYIVSSFGHLKKVAVNWLDKDDTIAHVKREAHW